MGCMVPSKQAIGMHDDYISTAKVVYSHITTSTQPYAYLKKKILKEAIYQHAAKANY